MKYSPLLSTETVHLEAPKSPTQTTGGRGVNRTEVYERAPMLNGDKKTPANLSMPSRIAPPLSPKSPGPLSPSSIRSPPGVLAVAAALSPRTLNVQPTLTAATPVSSAVPSASEVRSLAVEFEHTNSKLESAFARMHHERQSLTQETAVLRERAAHAEAQQNLLARQLDEARRQLEALRGHYLGLEEERAQHERVLDEREVRVRSCAERLGERTPDPLSPRFT